MSHNNITLNIPPGATANVKIIDTTSRISKLETSYFMRPPLAGMEYMPTLPAWSFLIESPSGRKILFDLGAPKDWEHLAPVTSERLKRLGWDIKVEKNVVEILEEHGVRGADVESMIWSHWHWDHIGDPSTFPSTTELVVGPGFKDAFLPGYPAKQDSPLRETDFKGRTVREIDFDNSQTIKVGPFRALDFFGDGSFYLVDTPGHAIGHMSGLARTTSNPDTFIFMGGDLCHHGGEIRPSKHLSIPAEITPQQCRALCCPGAMLEEVQKQRGRSPTEPFFEPNMGLSIEEAIRTIQKAQEIDASENVLFVFAHDDTLHGVVDLFPLSANEWKSKGWREQMQWVFLKDLKKAVEGSS
ncbi:beta-lactamase-like protein [Thermoascus aurantiacus ATCC 26904]